MSTVALPEQHMSDALNSNQQPLSLDDSLEEDSKQVENARAHKISKENSKALLFEKLAS